MGIPALGDTARQPAVVRWFAVGATKYGSYVADVAAEMVADGLLTPAEAQRAPVWMALSEFWLDTEQSSHFMDTLAEVVAATSFTADEVRRIHTHEVAPAVWWNLIDIAGEWAGFEAEWLFTRCARISRRSGWPRATIGRFLRSPIVRYATAAKVEDLLSRVDQRRAAHGGE